nr:nucleotide-binding alpha-beta plait domain-containing protein [Tanacetum cinerariifolium]
MRAVSASLHSIELLKARLTTLEEAFSLARITEARFEDERSAIAITKPNDLNTRVHVQDLEDTTRHKPNKVEAIKTSGSILLVESKYYAANLVGLIFNQRYVLESCYDKCLCYMRLFYKRLFKVTEVTNEFEVKERIAWIEVEGVPFRLWTRNTFARITDKWGKLLDVDDQDDSCFHSKRLCVQMKSSKSIQEELKIINRGKVYWIRASETPGWVPDFTDDTKDDDINSMDEGDAEHKPDDSDINNDEEKVPDTCFEEEEEVKSPVDEKNSENNLENSEDPFNIQSLLNRHKQGGKKDNISDSSLKYPSGFTPIARDTAEVRPGNIVEANDAQSECCEANKLKRNGNRSISSGHFKVSEAPRLGGSMIGLLEEVVKVGQVMGFKMDGCISNMEEIIGSQGVEDGYR